jgi:hypothetical protein
LTDDTTTFAATEAPLSERAQDDTEYTHHRTDETVVVKEFERFGISRTVEVTNVIAEYDRAIELELLATRLQAAVFATLSTPQVRILGRSFNPVADMSTVEIAEMVQERYDRIENVTEDVDFEATILDQTAKITRFTASARLVEAGSGVDIYLFVSEPVERGEDFLVTLAAHPQVFGQQHDTVEALLAGVERAEGEGT